MKPVQLVQCLCPLRDVTENNLDELFRRDGSHHAYHCPLWTPFAWDEDEKDSPCNCGHQEIAHRSDWGDGESRSCMMRGCRCSVFTPRPAGTVQCLS